MWPSEPTGHGYMVSNLCYKGGGDMIYQIAVYKVGGKKSTKLYSMEIDTRNPVVALEMAYVRLTPSREIVIRQVDTRRYE
jgi:hypothetical protein